MGAPTAERILPADVISERARVGNEVVDPARTAGLEYERGDVLSPDRPPAANRKALPCAGEDSERTVGFKSAQIRHVGTKQPLDLLSDRREHFLRRHTPSDQGCDAPQRRLLLRQLGETGAALCVGDRGRHQLHERRQARLGVRRQQLLLRTADDYHAPQAGLDDDRRGDRRPHPVLDGAVGERPRGITIVVDTGRTTRLEHERSDVLPTKLQPASSRQAVVGPAEANEGGGRIVGLIADQVHIFRGKQPSDLFGDRPEHLPRRYPSCHQRRDTPQRRLLLGQPTPRTSQRRSPSDLAPGANRL